MEYDLFICHASEDKDDFVRPLAKELGDSGYKVWYDEMTLFIGDSLSQKINEGLASSRYGIVVLSLSFFGKAWPEWELQGLISKHLVEKTILPVWHGVNRNDVLIYNPSLADIVAISSNEGVDTVVSGIHTVIKPQSVPRARLLSESKKHLSAGHYETAIIVASIRLHNFLREHALNGLGEAYFEMIGIPVDRCTIHKLINLFKSKRRIVTKKTPYTLSLREFEEYRNIALYGHKRKRITEAIAKRYIDNVIDLIEINSNRR